MATQLRELDVDLITRGHLEKGLKRLGSEFAGVFSTETVERYIDCVQILQGSARCADYAGDRVQSSRTEMAPIHERWLATLALHGRYVAALPVYAKMALGLLARQMEAQETLSEAQAGLMMFPGARNKREAYRDAVCKAAAELVQMGY